MTASPATPQPAAAAGRGPAAPRRRRWPFVVGGVLLVLLLALLVAPAVLASIARGRLLALTEERLDGKATLGELSIGLGGHVRASDFRIADRQGQPVLALGELDVQADVLGALSARYAADVTLRGLVLHVRRLPDGRLNLEALMRPVAAEVVASAETAARRSSASIAEPVPGGAAAAKRDVNAGSAATAERGEPLPDVAAHVSVQGAQILVHAPDGRQTELRGLDFDFDLRDWEQPAPFSLDLQLAGPAGASGTLHAVGTLRVAHEGRLDPERVVASLQYELGDLLLAALQPALDTVAAGAVGALEGRLAGTGTWDVAGVHSVNGRSELRLAGVRVQGGAPGSALLEVPDTTLSAVAAVDADGTGSQQLEVQAGELLGVSWAGTSSRLATPSGTLGGRLEARADVGALLALLRAPLGLKPELDFAGRFDLAAELQGAAAHSALTAAELRSAFKLSGLAARDARGVLQQNTEVPSIVGQLDGKLDLAAGLVQLSQLLVTAGPVQVLAHGAAGGLPLGDEAFDPRRLSISDSELLIDADLDRLARGLSAWVELPSGGFGGRVHVRATAANEGRLVRATTDVQLTGLRLPQPELGPLDLTLAQSGLFDLSEGGRSELSTLSVRSEALELDGAGAFTDLLDDDRRQGQLETTLRLRPGRASALLAGLLDGLAAEGEDLTVAQTVDAAGPRVDISTRVRAPRLTAQGGALGEQPLLLAGVELDAELGLDRAAQVIELQRLRVVSGPGRAAGTELPALELAARGAWDGSAGTLDVPEFTVSSALLAGGGHAKVSQLSQPDRGPSVEAQLSLHGEAEAARAFAAAFAPELAAARASGSWTLDVQAVTAGTSTHATPSFALAGVSLDGYVLDGEALALRDVSAGAKAELEVDSSGAGLATLKSLAVSAPGLSLTAEGRAAGFRAPGDAGGTPATGAGATADTAPLPANLEARLQTRLTLQPRELSTRLAAFLGGHALDGETLGGALTLTATSGVLTAHGALASPLLTLRLPADPDTGREAATLEQRDLQLDLDLTADLTPGSDSLALRTVKYASRTAQASVSGTLGGISQPESASADLTLMLRTQLAQVFADLGAVLPQPAWSGRGALAVDGTLEGRAGQLALKSRTTIDELSLLIPRPPQSEADAGAGGAASSGTGMGGAAPAPLQITDKRVQVDVAADIASGPLDVVIERFGVTSSFLSGSLTGRLLGLRALSTAGTAETSDSGAEPVVAPTDAHGAPLVARAEGLKGDFTWVPAQVGALLGPALPMQLSGDEPQPLAFTLDGPLQPRAGEPLAVLAALTGSTRAGLGTLSLPGLTLTGVADVALADGQAHTAGNFGVNGGSAALEAQLDLRPGSAGSASAGAAAAPGGAASSGGSGAPASHVTLKASGVKITQELGVLLASVHPLLAFGTNDQVAVASGAFGTDLDFHWRGPLPLGSAATPAVSGAGAGAGAGTDAGAAVPLDLTPLSGTAAVDFGTVTLASSPLLGEMLGHLGLGTTGQVAIQPVKLAVQDGRVAYSEPWTWTIKDFVTTFTGSVGMDQSLDLAWNVPITDALVAKYGFLKQLKGQKLAIPIRGTTSDPDLQWSSALQNLAGDALENELQEKVKDKLGGLGGLGGLLGGGDKPAGDGSGAAQATVTPAALLAQADALWDKGSKAEAKPLYKQLKDDFKLTLEYQLNKKRIDERAKWKP